jgi:hypothetical protein
MTTQEELDKVRAEFAKQTATTPEAKRDPVEFRYDAVLPGFLKQLAEIGHYASQKYGSWDSYLAGRLTGEKSPVNHIYEHLRAYAEGEPYEHFEGDVSRHLVAVSYNAMMMWAYHKLYGPAKHPFTEKLEQLAAGQRKEST